MKAAVLVEKERFEIREIPLPERGDKDILVKITHCSVCNGTDAKLYHGIHKLSVFPCLIGHECAGIVEWTGKDVTRFRVGDRVLGGVFRGTEQYPAIWGGYAEYGVCGENDLLPIPEGVNLEEATLAVMLGESLNAVRIGEVNPSDTVGIMGCGAVGLSILTVVRHSFPQKIIAFDISEEKLALAKEMGADEVINPTKQGSAEQVMALTEGKGLSKMFEATGRAEAYDLLYETAARNGVIIPFGIAGGPISVPFPSIYSRQLQIRWCAAAGDYNSLYKSAALHMLKHGFVDKRMITSVMPLDQIEEAFAKIAQGNEVRVIIQMNGGAL